MVGCGIGEESTRAEITLASYSIENIIASSVADSTERIIEALITVQNRTCITEIIGWVEIIKTGFITFSASCQRRTIQAVWK